MPIDSTLNLLLPITNHYSKLDVPLLLVSVKWLRQKKEGSFQLLGDITLNLLFPFKISMISFSMKNPKEKLTRCVTLFQGVNSAIILSKSIIQNVGVNGHIVRCCLTIVSKEKSLQLNFREKSFVFKKIGLRESFFTLKEYCMSFLPFEIWSIHFNHISSIYSQFSSFFFSISNIFFTIPSFSLLLSSSIIIPAFRTTFRS